MTEHELVGRIEECQRVVDEIDGSAVWQILRKDMEKQRKMLDDNWQDIVDEERLQKAREMKYATLHILGLKRKYIDELTDLQEELRKLQNVDTEIERDYDNETLMEG
jgi:hypothetical protein